MTTTTAVAYARVSSNEQATSGGSLEAQESSMRAYCSWRGMTLVDVVTDAGVSAGKPLASRAGGARILELLRERKAHAVVAMKLDRLFRSTTDCLTTTSAWDKESVAMHLVDMGGQTVDTSTTLGRFMLTLLAAMGEMERGLTGDRTRAVLAHKRAKGERTNAIAAYGYRHEGALLVEALAEQEVIRAIVAMRERGESLRSITVGLNEREGLRALARSGAWHATTVARILSAHDARKGGTGNDVVDKS